MTPLVCDHHVCEWNNTNFYGGKLTLKLPEYTRQTFRSDTGVSSGGAVVIDKKNKSSVCWLSAIKFDFSGPFIIPGDPGTGLSPIPPFLEQTTEAYHFSTEPPGHEYGNITCEYGSVYNFTFLSTNSEHVGIVFHWERYNLKSCSNKS